MHKSGKIHFHGLFKGYEGKLVKGINKKTGKLAKHRGKQVYNLKSFTSGFTDLTKIDQDPESQIRIGNYISKYITKELVIEPNINRYWVSKGLELPAKEINPDNSYKSLVPIHVVVMDSGIIKYFKNENSNV